MSNSEEQRDAFNRQMNTWSSNQGFWHQLRHTGEGQSVLLKLIRVLFTCAVFALIAAVVIGIYLYKRVSGDSFKAGVEQSLTHAFKAEESVISPINRSGNKASIGKLSITGSENSYFHEAKARHIAFDMGLLNSFKETWDLGAINIRKLEVALKSGESDDQRSREVYQSLFANYGAVEFKRVEIKDASFSWGYSEADRGSITGSQLTALRKGNEWVLKFNGGKLSHHWLNDIDIDTISVLCNEEGVKVTEALLSRSDGSISFTLGVDVSSQPKISGVFEMKSIPVESLITKEYKNLIRGSVSGKGELSGALNSKSGVLFDADLAFEEDSPLTFFDTLPILDALSVIDINRSYHKVIFDKASLNLQIAGDTKSFQDLKFYSASQLDVAGDFVIRPRSYAEVAEAVGFPEKEVKSLIEGDISFLDDLKADEESASFEPKEIKDAPLIRKMKKDAVNREFAITRFDGDLRILLNADAFAKTSALQNKYSVNESSGKIHLEMPFDGAFLSLTKELCEDLFKLGKMRD